MPTSTITPGSPTSTNTPTPELGNSAPQLTIYVSEVMVSRGGIALNAGDFRDANRDAVLLASSLGRVEQAGTSRGLWGWAYQVPANAARGSVITITITATDARGAATTRQFVMRVR